MHENNKIRAFFILKVIAELKKVREQLRIGLAT
jgi:hypothetical protein